MLVTLYFLGKKSQCLPYKMLSAKIATGSIGTRPPALETDALTITLMSILFNWIMLLPTDLLLFVCSFILQESGRVVTGQNPASATPFAHKMVEVIKKS